jgi:hypothetical protein
MKNKRVFYFAHADYLNKKRQSAIRKIPKERRFLRNNVEATIREFTCKMPQKKLRVRRGVQDGYLCLFGGDWR